MPKLSKLAPNDYCKYRLSVKCKIYSEGFIDDLDMGVAKARRFYVPIEVENNIP